MRMRKIWNQIISMILVLALLPVSALAQYGTDSTKDSRVINGPKFEVNQVYVDPQMEQLGLKIDRLPEYDFSALGSKTVNSMAEAGAYLREQFEKREEAITVTINNYWCDSQEQFDNDIAALQEAVLAHTGMPTQGDYIARHLTTYGIQGGLSGTQLTLYWTVVYKTTTEQEAVVDARVDELIAQWDAEYDIHDISNVEKVTVIYDYICENVVYDYDHLALGSNYPLMFSAYGALIDGTAVCQGYSNLFYRLALELGVDTRIISGIGNGGPHSWNITKLGDSYYYLDSTWDAPRAEVGYPYEYFLLGSEKFLADHSLDAEYKTEAFQKEYPISKSDYDFNADPGVIANGICGENLTWVLTADGTLTISGTGEMNDFKVRNQPWYDYRQQITAVVVEEGVTEIGRVAFFSFWEITSVTLPDSLTSIGGEAFAYCDSLREIVIPAGVMDIGDRAFVCCSALPAITVAADNAYYCSVDGVLFNKDMTELILYPSGKEGTVYKIPDGVTRLGLFAFEVRDTDLVEVIISASVVDLNGAFERAETLTTITVDSENAFYSSVDGVLFSKDLSTLINYPIGNTRTEYKIPDGVTTIFEYAFEQSLNLRRVIIPNGVTTIGALAFSWCEKLVKVVLPVSLTEIGEGAFDECQMLSKAYYVGTEEQWNGIWISERNDYLLNAVVYEADEADIYELEIVDQGTCGDNLTWVLTDDGTLTISGTGAMDDYDFGGAPWYAYGEQVAVVVIEDGVTSIGDNAFVALRNFTSITIPASVTSIGDIAFFLCNALTTVYYGGTEAQWKAIEIGVNNDLLLNANVVCAGTDDGGDAELITQAKKAGLLKYLEVTDLSANLSRLDAVKLFVAMMGLEPVSGATLPFTDCDALTQEEKELVAAAVAAGIIKGYDEYTFGPNEQLTYGQLAAMLCRALGESEELLVGPTWLVNATAILVDLGILKTEDGLTMGDPAQFRGTLTWMIRTKQVMNERADAELLAKAEAVGLLKYLEITDLSANLTRLEAVKLLVAMMDLTPKAGATIHFTDCDDLTQEEKELIAAALEVGLIAGTGTNTFAPHGQLTRAVLATLIYRALGSPKTENSEGSFPQWYLQAIIALQDLGIITEEDITTTVMENMDVGGALCWLIKAKAVMDDGGNTPVTRYEIHFLANGGKLIIDGNEYDGSKRMTNENGKLSEKEIPADPVRDGYTFAGWYTAAGERIDVTSETVFTENTDLYAHWLNSDGVDISNYALEFEISDNGLFVKVIPPVETENMFWVVFKNSKNTNQQSQYWCDYMVLLLPGDSCDVAEIYEFVDGETKLCGVVELTVPIRCETVQMQWPGTGDVGAAVTYNKESERYDFALSGLEAGYHYVLYSQATGGIPNGTRFNCRPDGTVSLSLRNLENNLELRAAACELKNGEYVISLSASRAVVPGSYSVTLDANGGDLGENASVFKTDKNGKVSNLPEPTRNGYIFEGWFTAADRGVVVNDTTVFMSDMTIYAQWTEAKHEHTEEVIPGKAATCTEDGLSEGKKCAECGEILLEQEVIPAPGHDYDDGVVITEPTVTKVGEMTYTCQRKGCGHTRTEEIPMLEAIARGICGEDLVWALDEEGTLTISGTGEMYDYQSAEPLQPQSFVPMSVSEIEVAPWSEYTAQITKVMIEEGVTSIGDNAFAACEKLTEIEIPKTVTEIGDDVFSGCEALETVTYTGSEEQWTEIEIGEGNEVVEEKLVISNVLMGDVTGDGVIDVGDAVKLLKAIASKETGKFSDDVFKAADVTRDGMIDVGDAVKLLKAIASKTTDKL